MTSQSEGKQFWNPEDVQKMKQLIQQGVPTDQIAQQLGKSVDDIMSKAREEGVNLMSMGSRSGQGQTGSQGGSQGGHGGSTGGSQQGENRGSSQDEGSQGRSKSPGSGPSGSSGKR